jgi:hypothetical protein
MPVKRACSCGKIFKTDTNDNKCPGCKALIEARCAKPIVERRNIPGELHFAFSESWVMQKSRELFNSSAYGHFDIDRKDKTKFAIWIYLFNFSHYFTDDLKIKKICNTISHEKLHESVYMNDFDIELTKKMDNGLMKKLTEEGYI